MSVHATQSEPLPRLFGTDGIRGPYGTAPLDPASLLRLGRALGRLLATEPGTPKVLIGGDTRESTPEISGWLLRGLSQTGCETLYGGVLPTPAVSRLAKSQACSVGIAVSASHNPFPDNGVKLLDGAGFKWSRKRESEIERAYAAEPEARAEELEADVVGGLEAVESLRQSYLDELVAYFPKEGLAGMSVVLDTANGAASGMAADFFSVLGANVVSIGDRPNGANINLTCGSTHPDSAIERTVQTGADIGFAFDGDADRAVAIDETGSLHDGDAMLYVLASWMLREGTLDPPRIVATSMSNLGLELALAQRGIGIVRCDVGDRAVVETLRSEGLVLGGEQAGHVVHLELSATGDGLLSAALLARAVHSAGRPLSQLAAGFRRLPQILRNIRVPSKPAFETLPGVASRVQWVERTLGSSGRLVLRYSGTEPLARVMIEGPDQAEIERLAEDLALAIQSEIEELGAVR